jgi:hypothetical protein
MGNAVAHLTGADDAHSVNIAHVVRRPFVRATVVPD